LAGTQRSFTECGIVKAGLVNNSLQSIAIALLDLLAEYRVCSSGYPLLLRECFFAEQAVEETLEAGAA